MVVVGVSWVDVVIRGLSMTFNLLLLARPGSCSAPSELHERLLSPSLVKAQTGGGGGEGGGVLPEKLGEGVRPTSQNSYPIYDQNLQFFLPYL